MGLASKITDKDWIRMQNLIRQEGAVPYAGKSVADKINKKDKALARFTAGIKLSGFPIEKFMEIAKTETPHSHAWESIPFMYFWKTAEKLGATPDEVEDLYTEYDIPEQFQEGNKQYVPVSDQERKVFCNGKWETRVYYGVQDNDIIKIAKTFDRYKIPVNFRCKLPSNIQQVYLPTRVLSAYYADDAVYYDITLFPNDEYSKVVLTMVMYNRGHSWMLIDFNPKFLGNEMELEIGQNFNSMFSCIKNYLGI